MAFSLNNFDKLSQAGLTQMMILWGYVSSADTLATIGASGYFNAVADSLKIGDYIYIKGSDGSNLYGVTAVSPNVTIAPNPDVVAPDSIVNADINSAAAIEFSKLEALPSAQILVGSAGNVPTAVDVTGDVTISNAGVTAIAAGVIVNTDINASAAIAFSKLATLTSGNILVGSAGNVPTSVAMSGDATIIANGTLTIANNAITTAKILNANVTLAKLATGITPSHVVKLGGKFTTVGGDATESITATGAVATDIAIVNVQTAGATPRSIVAAIPTTDAITVTMSGDPANDHILSWLILRAAS